jgi:hypothetical protein
LFRRRNVFKRSKKTYRVFKEADEGRRFTALYEHRERERQGAISIGKPFIIGIGAALIAGGVILTPLPGPGLTVITIGAAIIGTEFRITAKLLDRAEVKLHCGWRTLKERWATLSKPVKILLALIAVVLATTINVVSALLMFDVTG